MSTNPPKISLIDLCLTGPVADLLKKKDGYKEIRITDIHFIVTPELSTNNRKRAHLARLSSRQEALI